MNYVKEDNDECDVRRFQSIDHVGVAYCRVVLVEFVRSSRRSFHLGSFPFDRIHHVRIRRVAIGVEKVDDDDDGFARSKGNIIHNNLHTSDDRTEDNDDEQRVAQAAPLKIKGTVRRSIDRPSETNRRVIVLLVAFSRFLLCTRTFRPVLGQNRIEDKHRWYSERAQPERLVPIVP